MDRALCRRTESRPELDQPLVDAVELVRVRVRVLHPEPLDDRGFQQGGRRVGVVFEQLRWRAAIVGEVESAVDGQLVALPTLLEVADELRRDAEPVEQVALANVLDGLEAEVLQL